MDTNIIIEVPCFWCIHLKEYPNCDAFPNGIPQEIRDGTDLHTQPYDGDHGIQFEPVEDEQQ